MCHASWPEKDTVGGTNWLCMPFIHMNRTPAGPSRGSSGRGPVAFGANQVVLVRDMGVKARLPPELSPFAMSVVQAKGLEFDDVVLVDFFAASRATAGEWRVLNGFCEQLRAEVRL